jgi:RimJ/RimL family protein N-acetyltransferase
VLRLARTLGHRRIVAKHFTDNPNSGRVLAKLGFRSTGELRSSFSLARGCEAPALVHSVEFSAASDSDGDNDGFAGMRAA